MKLREHGVVDHDHVQHAELLRHCQPAQARGFDELGFRAQPQVVRESSLVFSGHPGHVTLHFRALSPPTREILP